ncbi:metallophosphoesterase [Nocardioides daeguensis]|uniref:Metallophosphoesterase n=1 Tax=Nocardioides daeguensis TaxID=908359 RepID=A0ABP6US60_9ACTN|nr:metallophosphoesterase [Nocardioides daeguensis]MBV6728676.1 metallophosphoesterase [Nocardioides daeguensis]MCR1773715.1 metallophosphoesterase [Nocardioides daeguensis]
MGFGRGLLRTAGAGGALGAAVTSYALWEARQYTLRRLDLRVLPAGMRPLRVLHLSDLHMTPGQTRKQEWLRDLARLEPDLVVDTGDNLAHRDAVPVVLDSLGPLLDRPGVFVHGSNDYFEPGFRNPFGYLLPDDGTRHTDVPPLPWRDLTAGFTGAGWVDLTNRRDRLTVGETVLALAGVDDPHLEYDDLAAVAGPADATADLRVAVAHAPYVRVLDRFAADGYDAILAGHTHGGQVRLPWPGGSRAYATNCDLEADRARGLHRHPADSRPGDPGSAWLHVSAGLGTNPYTRVRIACRPEATLLTLQPR